MNKKQRAAKAARAAKRLPVVGTVVVLAPLAEAAASSGIGNRFATSSGWRDFANELKFAYTGTDSSGNVNAGRLAATYVPIAVYLIAKKVGVGRVVGKVLGRVGLRF